MNMDKHKHELFDQGSRYPYLIRERRRVLTLKKYVEEKEYEEELIIYKKDTHPNDAICCIGGKDSKETNRKNKIGFVKED